MVQRKKKSRQMHILKYTAFEFYFTPIESKYLQTFGAFLAH